ncbi:MAG: VWA domain-containing protein, partial [Bryobacteraceae bacterium]
VLPWSICPAVPATTYFMRMLLIVLSMALGTVSLRAAAPADNETPTFRSGVADVRVDVRVTEDGKLVNDLSKSDFAVFDDGLVQDLSYFGHDREPVSILLLLDVSGSMQPRLQELAARAREALALLRPGDRVAIMVFGKRTAVHQDFFDNIGESARQIGLALRGHDVGSGTAINSALVDAAEYMKAHLKGVPGRRAILIVTDNLSINYRVPDQKAIRELESADAVLDAIVTGRGIRPSHPEPRQYLNPDSTPADVFLLAEKTGGVAIKSDRAGDSLRDMIESIRARYGLSYHAPGGAQPGSFRRIEVQLSMTARRRYPNALLQYRTGYYAPGS